MVLDLDEGEVRGRWGTPMVSTGMSSSCSLRSHFRDEHHESFHTQLQSFTVFQHRVSTSIGSNQLRHCLPTMFAPRFRSAVKPVSSAATQCLRQQQRQLPRNFISSQMRQQRHASGKSFRQSARELLRENPLSMTAALIS